jgi:hypothetical protein
MTNRRKKQTNVTWAGFPSWDGPIADASRVLPIVKNRAPDLIGFSTRTFAPYRVWTGQGGRSTGREAWNGAPVRTVSVWCRLIRHARHGARPGTPCHAVTDFLRLPVLRFRGSVIYCNQAHGARRARDTNTDTRGRPASATARASLAVHGCLQRASQSQACKTRDQATHLPLGQGKLRENDGY